MDAAELIAKLQEIGERFPRRNLPLVVRDHKIGVVVQRGALPLQQHGDVHVGRAIRIETIEIADEDY